MFRKRREIKRLLESVEEFLSQTYGHQRVMDLLSKENQRLREENQRLRLQNSQLFDRLMARDFEVYSSYKTEGEREAAATIRPFSTGSTYEPIEDQTNIGEVIEDETVR